MRFLNASSEKFADLALDYFLVQLCNSLGDGSTLLIYRIARRFSSSSGRPGGCEKAPAAQWQQALFGTPGATQDA